MLDKAKEELSWYEEHYGEGLLAGGETDDPIRPPEDGALVTSAGASGTTLELPNVKVRTAADGNRRAEVVVLKRNLM